jgi:hypothetical protein
MYMYFANLAIIYEKSVSPRPLFASELIYSLLY